MFKYITIGSILILLFYFCAELLSNYIVVLWKNKKELKIPILTQLKETIKKYFNKK